MEYRLLGRSGLKISTITMGTMTFGGSEKVGNVGLEDAQRQIDLCIDHGVNILDTANIYNQGVSEEIIGDALTDGRRDKVLLATKVRFPVGQGPNQSGLSRQHIMEQCKASLKRLRTDVIDLYQVHEWDGQTPLEETVEALDTLVRHGHVRYLGCSNYSAWHIMKALGIADARHAARFVSQQIHYTIEAREAENELVQVGLDQGLGILVWSPLAGGLLSGKYRRTGGPGSGRHVGGNREPPIRDWERLYDIVDALVEVGEGRGVSAAQVALAWLLSRPGVTSVVAGGRSEEQFRDNLGAADLRLSAEELARLDGVSRTPLQYPYWHQNWTASERFSANDLALHASHLGKD